MSSSEIPYISGLSHMMLQWHHDLVCWPSLHMYQINWAEAVALSEDVKTEALTTPFTKGEIVAPGTYCDIYLCTYNFMYVCMYICMYVWMDGCSGTWIQICMQVSYYNFIYNVTCTEGRQLQWFFYLCSLLHMLNAIIKSGVICISVNLDTIIC